MKNLCITLISILFCTQQVFATNPETLKKDERSIKNAYMFLEKHDFASFRKLCSSAYMELTNGNGIKLGLEDAIMQYKGFLEAFPDAKFNIKNISVAGNRRYLVEVAIKGTNTMPFMGIPPTGKSFQYTDIDFIEIDAKGLCFSHGSSNSNEPLRQIGLGYLTSPEFGTVMEAYMAFGKKDIEAVTSLCSDDVVFEIHDRTLDNKMRIYQGKAGIAQFFQELNSKLQYSKFVPNTFAANGEDVFCKVDAQFTRSMDGKMVQSEYAHHFKVSNGKIKYFRGLDDFGK